MTETNENPLETLVDLFVYAPIGLLYEHEDVLPQLVKRGRSQVQLARVVGQMALKHNVAGRRSPAAQIGQLQVPIEALASVAAQVITEIGSTIGLAPPRSMETTTDRTADTATQPTTSDRRDKTIEESADRGGPEPEPSVDDPARVADHPEPVAPDTIHRLPIARYDDLTAREIVGLLDDLTVSQLTRVGNYETANRARKTVLAKIARLQAEDNQRG